MSAGERRLCPESGRATPSPRCRHHAWVAPCEAVAEARSDQSRGATREQRAAASSPHMCRRHRQAGSSWTGYPGLGSRGSPTSQPGVCHGTLLAGEFGLRPSVWSGTSAADVAGQTSSARAASAPAGREPACSNIASPGLAAANWAHRGGLPPGRRPCLRGRRDRSARSEPRRAFRLQLPVVNAGSGKRRRSLGRSRLLPPHAAPPPCEAQVGGPRIGSGHEGREPSASVGLPRRRGVYDRVTGTERPANRVRLGPTPTKSTEVFRGGC